MFKILFSLSLIFICSTAIAQNIDEIVERNNKARNIDVYKAIKSIEAKGTINVNAQTISTKFYLIKPDKIRIESSALENKSTIVTNDKKGYATNGKDVRHMPEDKIEEIKKSLIEESNPYEPPFFEYKEKGDKVEFAGKESLEEGECDIVKYINKEGKEFFIYILENGLEAKIKYEEKGKDIEVFFKENKKSGGMLIPHLVLYNAEGEEFLKKKYDYIIYNGKIKEELFNIIEATKK